MVKQTAGRDQLVVLALKSVQLNDDAHTGLKQKTGNAV